ncbi:hypothetical protein LXL04_023784 [Taraxacum kok-saghyz]
MKRIVVKDMRKNGKENQMFQRKQREAKKEEVVKKAGKYNTKKKTQTLPKRRASSRLASVISNKKLEYTKKTVETVTVENSEDDDDDEAEVVERRSIKKNDAQRIKNVNEEEEEEEEVRERRSKNKHDGGSKEIVKNTRSLTRKGKDKKVVEEGGKGKIFVNGKKALLGNRKKEVVRKPKAANEFPSMKNRCSPIALLSIIHGLSKAQNNCVREMGFGALLQSKLMDVPMKMCYYVLERLDVEKMEVVVEKEVLNVNAESVHDMLGLPIGGTLFKDMPVVDEDDEDSCMFEWRQQYENTKHLRLKQ